MSSKTTAAQSRDRAGTERAILDAAKSVLAEEGFAAFGVNAIARRAGCDKQLIYRYYGGLDGLVDAIGAELSQLFQEHLAPPAEGACATYADFVEHMILALLRAFRTSDFLSRVAAWEILDPSPVTRRLAESRGKALGQWIQGQRGTLVPPGDRDYGAINAILIAAAQHLALSGRAVGGFGGVPLEAEQDWERISASMSQLVRSYYSA